jgi:hypothetical protein
MEVRAAGLSANVPIEAADQSTTATTNARPRSPPSRRRTGAAAGTRPAAAHDQRSRRPPRAIRGATRRVEPGAASRPTGSHDHQRADEQQERAAAPCRCVPTGKNTRSRKRSASSISHRTRDHSQSGTGQSTEGRRRAPQIHPERIRARRARDCGRDQHQWRRKGPPPRRRSDVKVCRGFGACASVARTRQEQATRPSDQRANHAREQHSGHEPQGEHQRAPQSPVSGKDEGPSGTARSGRAPRRCRAPGRPCDDGHRHSARAPAWTSGTCREVDRGPWGAFLETPRGPCQRASMPTRLGAKRPTRAGLERDKRARRMRRRMFASHRIMLARARGRPGGCRRRRARCWGARGGVSSSADVLPRATAVPTVATTSAQLPSAPDEGELLADEGAYRGQ